MVVDRNSNMVVAELAKSLAPRRLCEESSGSCRGCVSLWVVGLLLRRCRHPLLCNGVSGSCVIMRERSGKGIGESHSGCPMTVVFDGGRGSMEM